MLSTIHLLLQHSRRLLRDSALCLRVSVHVVIITFLPSFQSAHSASSLLIWVITVFSEKLVTCPNLLTHIYLIAYCICIHAGILSHTRVSHLHVIICILYKAGMPDRPPTAQLVWHLADTQLTWCITDRASVITRDWQTGKVTFRCRDSEMDIFRASGQIRQNHHKWLSVWSKELFKAGFTRRSVFPLILCLPAFPTVQSRSLPSRVCVCVYFPIQEL